MTDAWRKAFDNESSGKYDFCVWLPSDSTLTVVCDFGMLP